jgi:hypothetical protein
VIAALADPWPTAVIRSSDEATAAGRLRAFEAALGELPQAEWIEPFGPGDPAGWEVRIPLPGLTASAWAAVGHLASLQPGVSPARAAAEREDRVAAEILEAPGLALERLTIDGEPAPPLLLRREVSDPVLSALIAAVDAATRARVPGVALVEACPVIEFRTGKFGLELAFDGLGVDDARHGLAAAIAAGIGDVGLPVSSIGSWEAGFTVVIWLAVPPVPLLPEGGDSFDGGCGERIAAFELQVIPRRSHLEAALAVAALAEGDRVELSPAGGRWISVEGRLQFVPCWWAAAATLPPHPAIAAVRSVPVPRFLAEEWRSCDVACWVEGGVAFVRATGPAGADRVEIAREHELSPRDAWARAAADIGARSVRGLRDDLGDGLEWWFGPSSWSDLRDVLRRVAAISRGSTAEIGVVRFAQRPPILSEPYNPVLGTVAHSLDGTAIRVWFPPSA